MATKTEQPKPAMTTVKEVLEAQAAGKITVDDAARLIAQLNQSPGRARQRVIKLNQSGGLYVTDPSLKAYSEKKGKHYTAGFNLSPIEAVRELFANDDLIADIRKFLAQS